VTKPLFAAALLFAAAAAAQQWQPLFDGKSLDGWRETAFAGHGAVRVEKSTLVLGAGKPLTGVTRTAAFPRTNYEVRFEAARQEGSDFFASLTFPVQDSFCTWVLGGWGGDIVGLSSIDGWDASDNETRSYFTFETGRWYALRLEVTDARIRAWIDDRPIIDVEIAGRKVGLRYGDIKLSAPFGFASYNTTGALRKIEYRPLKPVERACFLYPFSVHPDRYGRFNQSLASAMFVMRPLTGSYSIRLPARCATSPSSICSIIVPE
jgi:hypothetical protein